LKKRKEKLMKTIEEIKKVFSDKNLFEQSLTHRSWINENPGVRESNERLEFLGDAILEFVVSTLLYNELPDKEEGFLTALRANIVNTQSLARVARKIDAGESLFMSRGEVQSGGRTNTSLLANTVEAIIGALFIDQGFEKAEEFIKLHLLSDLTEKLNEPLKDPKSRLQEAVQSKGFPAPRYKVIAESGPDHAKSFVVEVAYEEHSLARGEGKSKNQAEQAAAEAALVKMTSNR
jgi:ribonuclease-3